MSTKLDQTCRPSRSNDGIPLEIGDPASLMPPIVESETRMSTSNEPSSSRCPDIWGFMKHSGTRAFLSQYELAAGVRRSLNRMESVPQPAFNTNWSSSHKGPILAALWSESERHIKCCCFRDARCRIAHPAVGDPLQGSCLAEERLEERLRCGYAGSTMIG